MNLYGFASGDPVNCSDPFGLCPKDMGGDGQTKGNGDCPQGSKGWNQYRSGAIASAPFSPLTVEHATERTGIPTFSYEQVVA